ncbi:hypothetical protein ACU4HD_47555 [Cupriavidus basilensis]
MQGADRRRISRARQRKSRERTPIRTATRIVQLGERAPSFNPGRPVTRSHSEYVEDRWPGRHCDPGKPLVAERIAIDSYLEMIRYIGDRGQPTTRRVLGTDSLAVEEEHTYADELSDMLHDQ